MTSNMNGRRLMTMYWQAHVHLQTSHTFRCQKIQGEWVHGTLIQPVSLWNSKFWNILAHNSLYKCQNTTVIDSHSLQFNHAQIKPEYCASYCSWLPPQENKAVFKCNENVSHVTKLRVRHSLPQVSELNQPPCFWQS